MAEANRDRINPSLLDRLTDDAPGVPASRGAWTTVSELRKSVLRDLTWLFNTTQTLYGEQSEDWPQVRNSVVNFGLPPLAGQTAASLEVMDLERAIRQAIVEFEPRILAGTLQVRALVESDHLDHHNVIGIEIHGQLWAQPVPLDLLIRTEIDLETGKVRVADLASARSA